MARLPAGAAAALVALALLPSSAVAELNVQWLAGGGTQTVDNVAATQALLSQPTVVATLDRFAPLRQFVVDDFDSCTLRKVVPVPVSTSNTGQITTVAGNGCFGAAPAPVTLAANKTGTQIPIGHPTGVAGTAHGNGFIFGAANFVDRVNSDNALSDPGIVHTVAGSGSCGLNPPADATAATSAPFCSVRAVAHDHGLDDRFVVAADYGNGVGNKIRVYEVDGTPGTIKTIAGGCLAMPAALNVCFVGPLSMAYSLDGALVYVADGGTGKVWRFNRSDTSVAVTVATFTSPQGIAIGNDGDLFVSEGSCIIRRIHDPAGAATVTNLLPGPPCGNFEVNDPLTVPLSQAHIHEARGLDFGVSGLYVTDNIQGSVRLVDRTAINAGPARITNATIASFTYDSIDTSPTFSCQFPPPTLHACPTALSPLTALSDGLYTLWAQTTNAPSDESRATWDWTVDTTPPGAPALVEPADGASRLSPTTTFKWTPVNLKDPQELQGYDGKYELLIDGIKSGELASPCGDPCSLTLSGLGTGDHRWVVRAIDSAGNPTSSLERRFSTGGAPTAVLKIAPNPALTGRTVTFDGADSSDPDEAPIAKYEFDLDGDGNYETDNGTATATQTFNSVGSFKVGLRVTDRDGATGTAEQTLQVNSSGGQGLFGVTIENGAQFTRTPKVTVTANFPPTITQMLFSNDGGFLAPKTFTPKKTVEWTLDSSGPERLPKTIYVRFATGPILSETYQDDIILDETPPVVQQATVVPAAGAASAAKLRKYTVKVKAKDSNSGVSKLQITANKRKPGRLLTYKRKLVVKAGTRKLFVRARDRAGNFSSWKRAK